MANLRLKLHPLSAGLQRNVWKPDGLCHDLWQQLLTSEISGKLQE